MRWELFRYDLFGRENILLSGTVVIQAGNSKEMVGLVKTMGNIRALFIVVATIVLSGCGDQYVESIASDYDISEDEAAACHSEFGVGVRPVLDYLSEIRMPFPLSFFSDNCFDFINDSKLFGADYQSVIFAKSMGWEPKSKEFSEYLIEKKKQEEIKKRKEEIEKLEWMAALRSQAEVEKEWRYRQENQEYVSLLLGIMKMEDGERLERIARSFVDFFYYPKIESLKTRRNEFELKEYIDKKVQDTIMEAKSAENISYDNSNFIVDLDVYDFDRERFEINVKEEVEVVDLKVPCLKLGLRGICYDGDHSGREVNPSVPVGYLPKSISFILRGYPKYLYAPNGDARKIREGGNVYINGVVGVSIESNSWVVNVDVEDFNLVDYDGNIIARMCDYGNGCDGVYISN